MIDGLCLHQKFAPQAKLASVTIDLPPMADPPDRHDLLSIVYIVDNPIIPNPYPVAGTILELLVPRWTRVGTERADGVADSRIVVLGDST
jgi:hypothetical protein